MELLCEVILMLDWELAHQPGAEAASADVEYANTIARAPIMAVIRGDLDMVSFLLEGRNELSSQLEAEDADGRSLLYLATKHEHADIIELLARR